jgi:hypothetical protein
MDFQRVTILCIGWNVTEDNIRYEPIGCCYDPGTLCAAGKFAAGIIAIAIMRFGLTAARRIGAMIAE